MQQRVSGVDSGFSLGWLLQPLPVETFLREIWGATRHHVQHGYAGYFDDLLPGPSAVEDLEAYRREPAAVRLVGPEQTHGAG